jgi:hypothetical protein
VIGNTLIANRLWRSLHDERRHLFLERHLAPEL